MSRLIPAIIVVSLVAATAALAQTGGSSSSSGAKPGVWPAPTGHRQPSQTDLRSSGVNNQQIGPDAEEKALDKKIKSICKGC